MKKTVVAVLLVVAALAIFATGVAVAQSPQPPTPGTGTGFGAGHVRMGFSAAGGQEGPLHEYMTSAMADALGISTDEFDTRRAAGETAYQMALAERISADKIPALLSGARSKALDAAFADGVITQAQADWMKSRQARMGQGNCDGTGQALGMGMMGRGGRFQQGNP